MTARQARAPALARLSVLVLPAVAWVDSLASGTSSFALEAGLKLLISAIWLGLGVWSWFWMVRRGKRVAGVVCSALSGLTCSFSLLSLWFLWRAEQISRALGS